MKKETEKLKNQKERFEIGDSRFEILYIYQFAKLGLKLIIILLSSTFLVSNLQSPVSAGNSNFQQVIYPITDCNDGIDNDNDGAIDYGADPECSFWTDLTEDIIEMPPPPPPTPNPNPTAVPNPPPNQYYPPNNTVSIQVGGNGPKVVTPPPTSTPNKPVDNSNNNSGDTPDVSVSDEGNESQHDESKKGGLSDLQKLLLSACCLPAIMVLGFMIYSKRRKSE